MDNEFSFQGLFASGLYSCHLPTNFEISGPKYELGLPKTYFICETYFFNSIAVSCPKLLNKIPVKSN